MKQKHFLFILLAAIAVSFSACIQVNDSFGDGFVPGDQDISTNVYSVSNIPLYTATLDSISTMSYYAQRNVFGSINVSPFGKVNTNAILRFYPNVSEHRFGEHPEFISAEFTFLISGTKAADENQENVVQNIRIYELNKTLYYDSIYYNTSITQNDYNPTPISLPGVTYNGGDTLIVPITKEYGDFLMTATDSEMDSLTPFFSKYKGFVLGVDTLSDQAGRLNTLSTAIAYLKIQYRNDEGKDTSFLYWNDYPMIFSSIQHSSATLANYTDPPTTQSQTVYLEGLAGVKPVLDLLSIKDSIKTMLLKKNLRPDQLLINKLDIVISIPPTANMDNYPLRLTLCSRKVNDDSGRLTYPMIADVYGTTFGGTINRSLRNYSFNIARYIQRILQQEQAGEITDPTTLYVFPIATEQDMYGQSYEIIDVVNYTHIELLGTGSTSPVQMKLTYTILP